MDKPSDILEGAILSGRWERDNTFLPKCGETFTGWIRYTTQADMIPMHMCPLQIIVREHGGLGELDLRGNGYQVYVVKHFGMNYDHTKEVMRNADSDHPQDPVEHLRSLGF